MARHAKKSVDYFPLDVHLDDKIRLLEAKYHLIGFAVVIKLFQKIYGGEGYYCDFNDDKCLLFASETTQDYDLIKGIVTEAAARGIFNQDLYDKYRILTSHGIQVQYLEIAGRRSSIEIDGRYLLLSDAEIPINVYINCENVDINSKKADRSTQSKVKESKGNKSMPEKRQKHKYGEYKNVLLTDEELEKFKAEYRDWEERIERLSVYMESTGKSYKNHLATMKAWARKDRIQKQPQRREHENILDQLKKEGGWDDGQPNTK